MSVTPARAATRRGSVAASALFAALLLLSAGRLAAQDIRIGLVDGATTVTLGPSAFRVEETTGKKSLSVNRPIQVAISKNGVTVGEVPMSAPLRVKAESGDVLVNGKPYRGLIEILKDSGGLTVVNQLPVDDYVKGILAREMSPEWPEEALKAQAVISRTYAIRNRGRHGKSGYDLCATVHCQVYGGKAAERELTDRAVEDTKGEVLLHDGQLFSAVFHSSCGGRTESPADVWEGAPDSFMKPVRCSYCRNAPRWEWTARVPYDELERRLRGAGRDIGRFKSFKELSRSRSGRADRVRIAGSKDKAEMSSNQFRILMDPSVVRSTLWTGVAAKRDGLHFSGRGWGHGAGLCQWGAKGLAEKGKSYERILKFYYGPVDLKPFRES